MEPFFIVFKKNLIKIRRALYLFQIFLIDTRTTNKSCKRLYQLTFHLSLTVQFNTRQLNILTNKKKTPLCVCLVLILVCSPLIGELKYEPSLDPIQDIIRCQHITKKKNRCNNPKVLFRLLKKLSHLSLPLCLLWLLAIMNTQSTIKEITVHIPVSWVLMELKSHIIQSLSV